ncbi:MAG: hypothetical protein KGZ81_12560 [Flavobacteriales bacterium]|nr:hypothetical protein [Flavobacteriales bacterium]
MKRLLLILLILWSNFSFSQDNSCRIPNSFEIQVSSNFSGCLGSNLDIRVSSESVPSPRFFWYDDPSLSSPIFIGNVLNTIIDQDKTYYILVEGTGVCRSTLENAKIVSVDALDSPNKPTLPLGDLYFSPQGVGLDISSNLADDQNGSDFEIVYFNSFNQIIKVGQTLNISSSFPRGTYKYSVASRSKASGCISDKVPFSVIVEDPNIVLENCGSASSYTIPNLNCIACNVSNPSLAVDADFSTFSQILTFANPFNGFIGQNLIFPNLGYQGDSVKVFLSFPGGFPKGGKNSSLSFSLMNGTRRVSKKEYFLTAPELTVNEQNGVYVFSFLADLIDKDEPYVSVLVKNYSTTQEVIQQINVHGASVILATPTYPKDPIKICQGESASLFVEKGENTFLRW